MTRKMVGALPKTGARITPPNWGINGLFKRTSATPNECVEEMPRKNIIKLKLSGQ
jgi:hypothetical protein